MSAPPYISLNHRKPKQVRRSSIYMLEHLVLCENLGAEMFLLQLLTHLGPSLLPEQCLYYYR